MNKKQKKNFTVTIWDGMNIFLAIATAVTTIIFIILFVICFTEDVGTPNHGFILGMCGVFASLASAFFIAWVMRVYDIKHKKDQEQKALTILQPYLKKYFQPSISFFLSSRVLQLLTMMIQSSILTKLFTIPILAKNMPIVLLSI